MIIGEGRATVRASTADVVELVLDLERYRKADHKIGKVGAIERDGDHGTATFSGRIRGLPGPQGTYPFAITDSGLRFRGPTAGPARWFLDFEGTFECRELDGGTQVVHREVFAFKVPWRWIAEPLLGTWLSRDATEEMVRFKRLVEQPADSVRGTDPTVAADDLDAAAARRRKVRLLQKYLLNPPVKAAAMWGLAPGLAVVETTGRRTGKIRRTVVGVHRVGDRIWIVAEQGTHAGYVRNIEANPAVRLRLKGRWRRGIATVESDDDPLARLERFGRPAHAKAVRQFGTALTTVRIDLTG